MKRYEHTSMGGSIEAFLTTRWSVIDKIAADGDTPNHALINELLKKYWKPVYCFLRRKGYDNEQAKDLTQGFFQEVVLDRGLIQRADQSRGRFRTFLLSALEQYLARLHRKETAQKRIPKDKLILLEQIDSAELPESVGDLTPEESFNYAWVSQLLDKLLAEVEARCRADDKTLHWQVFHDRVLQPIMENTHAPSLTEICDKYGIENERKASNMIVTVDRRFQAALKRHLRRSVTGDAEVDEELQELMKIFFRKGAG
ncbi:MAG: RNA polymerase sigma factor [Planctomycetota bacterium]|jgi:RNA polymerase sigma-70 factor (ECF subfamily)